MHPKKGLRHSPISGVVLTNGDVDHVAGLLTLRERQNLSLYAHSRVHTVLKENSIFNVLNPDYVDRRDLKMNSNFELLNKAGEGSGIYVWKLLKCLVKLLYGSRTRVKEKILVLRREILLV